MVDRAATDILLLGAKGAGKTSLAATALHALRSGGHAYGPHPLVGYVDDAEHRALATGWIAGRPEVPDPHSVLDMHIMRLRIELRVGGGTAPIRPGGGGSGPGPAGARRGWTGWLGRRRQAGPALPVPEPAAPAGALAAEHPGRLFRLVDPVCTVPCEHIVDALASGRHRYGDYDLTAAVGLLRDRLQSASALVLCVPVLPPRPQQPVVAAVPQAWTNLLALVGNGSLGPFETVVIAFTRYELLFAGEGTSGLAHALDPHRALFHMAATVRHDDGLRHGLPMLADLAETDVWCCPVSSYGFLDPDGIPNIDLWTLQPLLSPCSALGGGPAGGLLDGLKSRAPAAGSALGWCPFLTGDPLVACLTREPGALMQPLARVLRAVDHLEALGKALGARARARMES